MLQAQAAHFAHWRSYCLGSSGQLHQVEVEEDLLIDNLREAVVDETPQLQS